MVADSELSEGNQERSAMTPLVGFKLDEKLMKRVENYRKLLFGQHCCITMIGIEGVYKAYSLIGKQ